ncbi:DUF6520 family protein [Flavobacterium selenitireducens]|uniref:DUF6520 family protein n=1 Tax=Flavobacterium selenitireducens TaxID=2722704 RepID=UPI00168B24ED|nr:DUF6520 family protein [Flavobacterium selenitireducens]MBD3581293.1 hypothetical protein [Flavobacterium selenitireducens]
MKTTLKGIVMPVATLVLGAAGAFATTSMASDEAPTIITGRYYVSSADPCHLSDVECTDVFNDNGACTSPQGTLWKMDSPVTCPLPLYKIQP